MSVYSVKGKGWRVDFTLDKQRYTQAWYETKRKAKQAEAQARKALLTPTQIDTVFLDLVNRKLDHMHAYSSKAHYDDFRYRCRPWIQLWGSLDCKNITPELIQSFILERSKVSPGTANRDVVGLRSLFNFGLRHNLCAGNPANRITFLPVEKKLKYIPPLEDIFKVIGAADPDTQDYLWAIRETMARVSEINRLEWEDVDLEDRHLILYTRKKKGGNLTPRKVPLTDHLYKILSRRYASRKTLTSISMVTSTSTATPWVFWHLYKGQPKPWGKRNRLVPRLCKKAGVRHFTFHSLRHSGASVLDSLGIPIGTIQRLLGHSNRKTTEIYLQSIGESERQAMAIFEQKSHTESHTESPTTRSKARGGGGSNSRKG